MEDETFIMKKTEDELWDCLCEAVEAGHGFSLEYGAEQHQDDVHGMDVKSRIHGRLHV
jgi:hypothetical protein